MIILNECRLDGQCINTNRTGAFPTVTSQTTCYRIKVNKLDDQFSYWKQKRNERQTLKDWLIKQLFDWIIIQTIRAIFQIRSFDPFPVRLVLIIHGTAWAVNDRFLTFVSGRGCTCSARDATVATTHHHGSRQAGGEPVLSHFVPATENSPGFCVSSC